MKSLRWYKNGVKSLEKWLSSEFSDFGQAKVYANYEDGMRVVELIFFQDDSGSSFMRDDCCPESGAILLACEDFVLRYKTKPWRPGGWTSDMDVLEDTKHRLRTFLKKG